MIVLQGFGLSLVLLGANGEETSERVPARTGENVLRATDRTFRLGVCIGDGPVTYSEDISGLQISEHDSFIVNIGNSISGETPTTMSVEPVVLQAFPADLDYVGTSEEWFTTVKICANTVGWTKKQWRHYSNWLDRVGGTVLHPSPNRLDDYRWNPRKQVMEQVIRVSIPK